MGRFFQWLFGRWFVTQAQLDDVQQQINDLDERVALLEMLIS